MARTYKVIDADGHILEPTDLWDNYMDPAHREHAPRMILDDNGKERQAASFYGVNAPREETRALTGITATDNAGANAPHNNMHPFVVLTFVIKYK